jgi:PAS domain S-box-containing protein
MYEPYPYRFRIPLFAGVLLLAGGIILKALGIVPWSTPQNWTPSLTILRWGLLILVPVLYIKVTRLVHSRESIIIALGVLASLTGLLLQTLVFTRLFPAPSAFPRQALDLLTDMALYVALLLSTVQTDRKLPKSSRQTWIWGAPPLVVVTVILGSILLTVTVFPKGFILDNQPHVLQALLGIDLAIAGLAIVIRMVQYIRHHISINLGAAAALLCLIGHSLYRFPELASVIGEPQDHMLFQVAGLAFLAWLPFEEHIRFMRPEIQARRELESRLFDAEQELKRHRNWVDSHSLGIIDIDRQGVIHFINPGIKHLFAPALLKAGTPLDRFISPSDTERWKSAQEQWRTGKQTLVELTLTGHKAEHPVLIVAIPRVEQGNRFSGCRLFVMDRSKSAQRESRSQEHIDTLENQLKDLHQTLKTRTWDLEALQNKFRACSDTLSELILIFDLSGRCTFINRAARERLGYSPEALTPDTLPDFFFDINKIKSRTGDAMSIELTDYETWITPRHGKPILSRWRARLIKDPDGSAHGILFTGTDISAEHQLKTQLNRHQEQQEKHILDRTRRLSRQMEQISSLFTTHSFSSPRRDNASLEQLCQSLRKTGWKVVILKPSDPSLEEISHQYVAGLRYNRIQPFLKQHPLDTSHPETYMEEETRYGPGYWIQNPARSARSTLQWQQGDLYLLPVFDHEKPIAWLFLFDPVGGTLPSQNELEYLDLYRKTIAHQLCPQNSAPISETSSAAEDPKDEMTRLLVHELRTPLHSILTSTELLLQQEYDHLAPHQNNQIDLIRTNTHLLLNWIDNWLDYSRLQSGHIKNHFEYFDLRESLEAVFTPLIPLCQKKAIRLNQRIDPDIPRNIFHDREKIVRVLTNLLHNAVKFTEKGSIRFTVRCNRNGSELKFMIRDTGTGMRQTELERLFKPFQRGHPHQTGGSGLGLYLSRMLWERLDGSLLVKSKPDKGTQFDLTLPLQTVAEPKEEEPKPAFERADKPSSGRVMVIDDHIENEQAIRTAIEQAGFQVIFAATSKKAVRRARKQVPDLILLDIQLPDRNGYETLKTLRSIRGLESVPIIATSALDAEKEGPRAKASGFQDYLEKPFTLSQLIKKVSKWHLKT